MQAQTDFFIFTQTPVSAHYTGMILDDMSSEFNTYAPDFGEKFAVPFVPVSFRDFNGSKFRACSRPVRHVRRVGLLHLAGESPNPTGYAPNMMITCMNDPVRFPIQGIRDSSSPIPCTTHVQQFLLHVAFHAG